VSEQFEYELRLQATQGNFSPPKTQQQYLLQLLSKNFQRFIASTHGVIVDLSSWAFFVAVPMIVPAEDSEPGTVPVP
jgi:hypothetical protein